MAPTNLQNLPNPSHNFSSLAFSIQLLLSRPLASVSPATAALVSAQGQLTYNSTSSSASARQLKWFNIGEGCLVFEGLFEFYQAFAYGSIGAAVKINREDADIAINWGGGLHHTKKCEASDFCYVNDIVLDILELLKYHRPLHISCGSLHGSLSAQALVSILLVISIYGPLEIHRTYLGTETQMDISETLSSSCIQKSLDSGKTSFSVAHQEDASSNTTFREV
ncbi:hypothetical protein ZIOFF_061954 [Zingiber officinale]|uniref:Histone deacetylase domain-containing protein n=1 Tax=Zingiber officinale TaxID=94328 RepID=A0A8J5KA90_ZINOF|nr:hypothetical protein ZIOFF_061954 [Zingiber officinale]